MFWFSSLARHSFTATLEGHLALATFVLDVVSVHRRSLGPPMGRLQSSHAVKEYCLLSRITWQRSLIPVSSPSLSWPAQSRRPQSRLPFQSSTRPHSIPRSLTAGSLRSRPRPEPAARANPVALSPVPRLHTKKTPKCSRSFPSLVPQTLELGTEPPRSAASATPPVPFLPSPSTESCAPHSPPASARPARTSARVA